MNKLIFVALAILTLSACGGNSTGSYSDYTQNYNVLPPELKDCKVYGVHSNDGGGYMQTLVCPTKQTQTTSYMSGKSIQSAIIVKDLPVSSSSAEFKALLINKDHNTTYINCKLDNNLVVCFQEDSK
jgi:hypothetical protein